MSARKIFIDLLKAYRDGETQEQAAGALHVSLSAYKKVEQGVYRPQRDFAERCDQRYGLKRVFTTTYDALVTEPHPGWFAARAMYEDQASVIHEWEMRGVPGILQTEAYARSVFESGRPYDSHEAIAAGIQARMDRQVILVRDDPPKLWVVIDEGALRRMAGTAEVMRDQLEHLLEVSASQQVVLQVLPFRAQAPGANGPIVLFEFAGGRPPIAYLEDWGAGRIVEDPQTVADVATSLSMVKSCALSPQDSRALVAAIKESM
jgi:hypothetical protein